eukprot:TRINITY_DN37342_c0_g1_i1.p1 TRINITY_DN37342_c0_g1~~TRINITY_DN37342_c0_g1_i1.p1  ORF type:complete len:563 (-),score=108.91 TRINITY_DN37342_c0_g1_i1:225-1913(-)
MASPRLKDDVAIMADVEGGVDSKDEEMKGVISQQLKGGSPAEKEESRRRLCDVKAPIVLLLSAVILLVCQSVELDKVHPKAGSGLAVLLITALWWISEVLPLVITSLLPMVLYPLLGTIKASALAEHFFQGTTFLFIAGFWIGLALERWGLHTRLVCSVVSHCGSRIDAVTAGFMLSTWFLSMWISNTACILCMQPMALAFLSALPSGTENLQSAFLLAVGYSATLGGLATPVGTPTNGIFMGQFEQFWPEAGEFPFMTFCMCAMPLSLFLVVAVWFMAMIPNVWLAKTKVTVEEGLFLDWYASLGKLTYEEIVVAADLFLLVVAWCTATPIGSFPGWKASVSSDLNSGAVGLAFTLPLFLIPCGSRLPARLRRLLGEERCQSAIEGQTPPRCILDWDAVKNSFKWEILFVFGGGYMIATGTVASGLAAVIAQNLSSLPFTELTFLFIVILVVTFVTEVVSNMATLSIFGSIIVATAFGKGYDQVVYLLAVTFAASYAFMLPMAGGPNMVVYSSGKVSIRRMASFGFFVNLLAILAGCLYTYFVLPGILGGTYETLPAPSAE